MTAFAGELGEPYGAAVISTLQGSFFADLQNGEQFGSAVCSPGDLDRDGIPDLLVGAPGRDNQAGAAYLLWINNDGWTHRWLRFAEGENGLSGLEPGDAFGSAVTELGDVDGNGFNDLAIGAPGADSGCGAIWILYRDAVGLMEILRLAGQDVPGLGCTPASGFGTALTRFETWNDKPGLVIGVPGLDRLVYVAFQSDGSLENPRVIPAPDAAIGGNFGFALDGRADGTGDGKTDLLVGAPSAEAGKGVAFVLLGGRLPTKENWLMLDPPAEAGRIGYGSALCWIMDMDRNDGADAVVGMPGNDTTTASYHYCQLDSNGTVQFGASHEAAHVRFDPFNLENQGFGTAMGNLGDLNSDHHPEIVLGLPGRDDGGLDRGALLITRLRRAGVELVYDYHEACCNEKRIERLAVPTLGQDSTWVAIPDPSTCDSVTVEILFRQQPPATHPVLVRAGYANQAMKWEDLEHSDADSTHNWAASRITIHNPGGFWVRKTTFASGIMLHLYRHGTSIEIQGTKGLYTRYTVAPGGMDRRFLTTVLFSSPRNIFIELDVVGLEMGKTADIRAAVREMAQYRSVTGNGDSIQKIVFEFPGIPGSVHGVSIEVSSPDNNNGGRFSYAWSAGYECGVICQAPAQRFFVPLDTSSGRLFWQRIPTGARQYEWSLFAGTDSSNRRQGTMLSSREIYPGVDIDNLVPGTTYHYQVRNDCNSGIWSGWSDYSTFVFPYARQAQDKPPLQEEEWSVYPNPSTGRVFLQVPSDAQDPVRWEWISLDGRVKAADRVTSNSVGPINLMLPHGPPGVYLLRVYDGTQFRVFKVLKALP